MSAALLMQGCYLCIDVMQRFGMSRKEPVAPSLQAWQVSNPSDKAHDETVLVASIKEIEGNEAEDDDDAKHSADRRVKGKIANGCQSEIEKD